MPIQTIWRSKKGELFHENCFEEGESKEGFTQVKLTELEEDDECGSCGEIFLIGVVSDDDEEDNGK